LADYSWHICLASRTSARVYIPKNHQTNAPTDINFAHILSVLREPTDQKVTPIKTESATNGGRMKQSFTRRQALALAALGCGSLIAPQSVLAALNAAVKTPSMTDGPFYPEAKDLPLDQDNDLTTFAGKSGVASGVLLDFAGRVMNDQGRVMKNAMVEIWQCNAFGRYHHSSDNNRAPLDPAFQGFGKVVTDSEGRYRFRTIRPVAYSGRVPHIHVKVKSRSFGELTSQIFIEGESGNDRDFVLRSIRDEATRKRVMMTLKPAAPESGVKLTGEFDIVVGS
jgi:protocatechuate 3,4-dioxygenase, beta subunit